MNRKTILLTAATLLIAVALTSLASGPGYTYEGETPGTLTAIGDAGSPNVFTFERWHFAEFALPDNDPSQIQATIAIDITSVVCDWKELEASVKAKKDYFRVKKFPEATVIVNGATLQEDGSYTTEALLSLKGIENPVTLSFTLEEVEVGYRIQGNGNLNRRDFRFTGDGPKDEVPIAFDAVVEK